MLRKLIPLGVMLGGLLPALASGQAERVSDLNTAGATSRPDEFFRLGTNTFLSADDGEHGEELWVILDGSPARLVKDIDPGFHSSSPAQFTAFGGQLYFTAGTADEGYELWRTDGSESGTVLVADVRPGTGSSYPQYLTACADTLYFSAEDADNGRELWKADGAGASLVLDIETGAGSSNPSGLAAVPDGSSGCMLAFNAETTASGAEPWISQGATGNTVQLADLASGAGSSDPYEFVTAGGRIFFTARGGDGKELWAYDPSSELMQQYNIDGISNGTGSSPRDLTPLGDDLYFSAYHGNELWVFHATDPAPIVIDVGGIAESEPRDLTVAGGTLFFTAEGATYGRELGYVRGTTRGFAYDINPGVEDSRVTGLTASGGYVFFSADDGSHGAELWKASSSTPTSVSLVKDINPGIGFSLGNLGDGEIVADATGVTFRADDGEHGVEPWHSDGTGAGTQLLADINSDTADSEPRRFTAFNGEIYFTATDAEHGVELRAFDGETIRLVKDIHPGPDDASPRELTIVGETLFFAAEDGVHGAELWKTDGTSAGTGIVTDIIPGEEGSEIEELFAFEGRLLFQAYDGMHGSELWISDGTAAGTTMVEDISSDDDSSPAEFTALGGTVYFRATDGEDGSYGYELWKTDGTADGTGIAVDWLAGPDGSRPNNLTAVDGKLYFSYETASGDQRLGASDGTPAGTTLIADLDPAGEDRIRSLNYVPALGLIVIEARTDANGWELWVSDGTSEGTALFDINAGTDSSNPDSWIAYEGALYFSAEDGNGDELWRYEPGGTPVRITDASPGSGSNNPHGMTVFDGKMYFAMSDDAGDSELWSSDGTTAGTVLVQDIDPAGPSYPYGFFATGNYLLFSADDGETGVEIWKLDKPADDPPPPGDDDPPPPGDDDPPPPGDDDPPPADDDPPPTSDDDDTPPTDDPQPPTGGGGGGGALSWPMLCALLLWALPVLTVRQRRRNA